MVKKNILWPVILLAVIAAPGEPQFHNPSRDARDQPKKAMELAGVKPGMVIGEIGAGRGYFTFWLSRGVGATGKVYANDIDRSALDSIERGAVEDPRLPAGALDMVFMVNAFHDLASPIELLVNLRPALKPGATVVIMDPDPARTGDRHFLSREKVGEIVGRSVFELVRVETSLREHNLYILTARKPA